MNEKENFDLNLIGAQQGNAIAQYNVGLHYAQGFGVNQNMEEALKWWHLSARAGNPDAMSCLGDAYANGHGVEINIFKALKWWTSAAWLGDKDAVENIKAYDMNYFIENGGEHIDNDEIRNLEEQSYDVGPNELFQLGKLFADYEGPFSIKTWKWLTLAYLKGSDEAGELIAMLEKTPVKFV